MQKTAYFLYFQEVKLLMTQKPSKTPLLPELHETPEIPIGIRMRERTNLPKLWIWPSILLALGLIVGGIVGSAIWSWLKNIDIPTSNTGPAPITTLKVQRTVSYADLTFTILTAQYSTSFADDEIHAGQGIVRVNMHVANHSTIQVGVVYYNIARLLAPKLDPIAPGNVHLSVSPKPGSSETGWIDFPIAKSVQLNTLKLQLGSMPLGESLVTVPFTGPFDPSRYANKVSSQDQTFYYNFRGSILIYHLTSVEIRYSYRGAQCKAGQQFYVLNFRVDNPNDGNVSPGFGYDYLRLVINGTDRAPLDSTLPYGFNGGATGVSGHAEFAAPAGMKTITIGFLSQLGYGQETKYDV